MEIELKIVVTTESLHPCFNGIETFVRDFTDLKKAEDYLSDCKIREKDSQGFERSWISLVQTKREQELDFSFKTSKMEKTEIEILKKNLCDYAWLKTNYEGTFNHILKAMTEFGNQRYAEGRSRILGMDNPFPLRIVLERLVQATNHLLHAKNYDGDRYEEFGICVKRANEIIEELNSPKK